MKVMIHGTNKFDQYDIFINALGRVIRSIPEEDGELTLFPLGPTNVNSMCHEFINISERSLKANGIKGKVIPRPVKWGKDNYKDFDLFLFFCKPKEPLSDIATLIDKKGSPDVLVYRY